MSDRVEDPGQSSEDEFGSGGARSIDRLLAVLLSDRILLHDRLARQLGSRETADDLLQEMYLKLRSGPQVGDVRNPRAYLYRMAINLARNQRRNDSRMVAGDETIFLGLPDPAPDPEQVLLASDEMSGALALLHALPARRREIFLAKWRDEKTQSVIAAEFGMHKRSVQKELSRVELFLRKKLRPPK